MSLGRRDQNMPPLLNATHICWHACTSGNVHVTFITGLIRFEHLLVHPTGANVKNLAGPRNECNVNLVAFWGTNGKRSQKSSGQAIIQLKCGRAEIEWNTVPCTMIIKTLESLKRTLTWYWSPGGDACRCLVFGNRTLLLQVRSDK